MVAGRLDVKLDRQVEARSRIEVLRVADEEPHPARDLGERGWVDRHMQALPEVRPASGTTIARSLGPPQS
jgi:hypothetical protein